MDYFNDFEVNRRLSFCEKNQFLRKEIKLFSYTDYLRYKNPRNPNFLLVFKNGYNAEKIQDLQRASQKVVDILKKEIPLVIEDLRWHSSITILCVPRSRSEHKLSDEQKYFRKSVSSFAKSNGYEDCTSAIIRHTSTATTHLLNSRTPTDGDRPYPGITKNTCSIDGESIRGKRIILVDDIYTKGVNVIEDCVQTLLDCGAQDVVVYTIAYTV